MDLGRILDVVLDKFSMIFLLCSGSVFDIKDVGNVYKLGVKYVWVLHKLSLWQDSVEY